jgi:hypothetical protein
MLKIKDDVDLKELEKFGLYIEPDSCGNYEEQLNTYLDRPKGIVLQEAVLLINKNEIVINTTVSECYKNTNLTVTVTNLDIIYDLIQAGIVEKVKR